MTVSKPARSRAATRDDPSVVALVLRAAEGDQRAWDEIVERYAPLVYAICTRYRLSSHDIEDVGQTAWLLLVEHLGQLREPAALPGWLATTTARECLRVVKAASRSEGRRTGQDDSLRFVDDTAIDEEILMAERNAGLRALFAELPARCQQLLAMLISDPPHSYAMIHEALGIPVGSIGPQRARCLDRLRRSSAFSALGEGEIAGQGSGR
ncbi:MAG TPA: sigma-70 family RNA polymerase sigma factor [Propionibacteriaceae bacterium]|nr:sigma-70 family RNA polymerase sigma factor [Propionibacteriaceae bacterium]